MSPSQHMGLPILCTPQRVSVDPGNAILMSWNSASHQLTILHFMIKKTSVEFIGMSYFSLPHLLFQKELPVFLVCNNLNFAFWPSATHNTLPTKEPFSLYPCIIALWLSSFARIIFSPAQVSARLSKGLLLLYFLNWKLRSQSWWLIGQLPPWPIAFLTQQGVVVEVMSAKLTTIKHLMS